MAVTELLDSAGIHVVGRAQDGAAALMLAKALRPDLVTMDIDMPVMDGVEATRQLHERYPAIAVLLLTGSDASDRITVALAHGAVGHVPKGRATEALVAAIRAALAQPS